MQKTWDNIASLLLLGNPSSWLNLTLQQLSKQRRAGQRARATSQKITTSFLPLSPFLALKKKVLAQPTDIEDIMWTSGSYRCLKPAFSLISFYVVILTCTHCQEEFDSVQVSFKSLTYLICTAGLFALPSPGHSFSRCILFNGVLEEVEVIAPPTVFKYLQYLQF